MGAMTIHLGWNMEVDEKRLILKMILIRAMVLFLLLSCSSERKERPEVAWLVEVTAAVQKTVPVQLRAIVTLPWKLREKKGRSLPMPSLKAASFDSVQS
jgi:hypothetical protein